MSFYHNNSEFNEYKCARTQSNKISPLYHSCVLFRNDPQFLTSAVDFEKYRSWLVCFPGTFVNQR